TISGAYGIGGGALLAPILISVFMLPPHAIASSTLTGTFTTSIMGVCFYYLLDYPPNWKIAILFGIGGMLGMYTGARTQKYIPERVIKIILAFLIFIPALKYILDYF
ncbi:MAG: sulfite exporter TauE/SafE family protein, partial [Candidatus Desulfofervidus auxilii]|nr:sulfite exporter TauE/SafE family protein [Candidatus Desulfofervidus auxilii]